MEFFSQNFFNLKLNNENTEKILLGQKGNQKKLLNKAEKHQNKDKNHISYYEINV